MYLWSRNSLKKFRTESGFALIVTLLLLLVLMLMAAGVAYHGWSVEEVVGLLERN